MHPILFLVFFFILYISSGIDAYRSSSPLNNRPIVGIVTCADNDHDPQHSHLPSSYVKWLEQSGIRVIPIPFNLSPSAFDYLLDRLNGLLFTGGGLSLNYTTLYYQNSKYLYNKIIQKNQQGIHFPLWGTCQGFQLINVLGSEASTKDDILQCVFDSENITLSLDFSSAAKQSKLYGPSIDLPNEYSIDNGEYQTIYQTFSNKNITINLHHCGITVNNFNKYPGLTNNYSILSTNNDRQNKQFISSIEHKQYPIYAVQYHPERNAYEWDTVELVDHSLIAISAVNYLSGRLSIETRRSYQYFDNKNIEDQLLIYRYPAIYTGNDPTQVYPDRTMYYFDQSHTDNIEKIIQSARKH